MADNEPTLPPVREPNTPRNLLLHLWSWGTAHTVISAAIIGALTGFIAGKML